MVNNSGANQPETLKDDMNKKVLEGIDGIKICESHCNFVLENCSPDRKLRTQEGINPIGICGNQCECNCSLFLEGCDGCRSNKFGCAFSAFFEDKKCPNVACAQEKNLDGCYECDKLENCEIGFYGIGIYFGKASALFIKKYGDECFMKTLEKAVNTGEDFIKKFFNNGAGNVDKTLLLLETYMMNK